MAADVDVRHIMFPHRPTRICYFSGHNRHGYSVEGFSLLAFCDGLLKFIAYLKPNDACMWWFLLPRVPLNISLRVKRLVNFRKDLCHFLVDFNFHHYVDATGDL